MKIKVKLGNILCKQCMEKYNAACEAEHARRQLPIAQRQLKKKGKNWTDAKRNGLKRIIARGMRYCPTPSEQRMKEALEGARLPFEHQKQIGPFIADFYVPPHLVIEVDGSIHEGNRQKVYDASRDRFMIGKGFKVLRFKNEELVGDCSRVLRQITQELGA